MGRIRFDVGGNPLIFCIRPNDAIVKFRLPCMFQAQTIGVFGNGRFVRTDDGRQGVFSDILKSTLARGFIRIVGGVI